MTLPPAPQTISTSGEEHALYPRSLSLRLCTDEAARGLEGQQLPLHFSSACPPSSSAKKSTSKTASVQSERARAGTLYCLHISKLSAPLGRPKLSSRCESSVFDPRTGLLDRPDRVERPSSIPLGLFQDPHALVHTDSRRKQKCSLCRTQPHPRWHRSLPCWKSK
jgi:hypothetical protein